MGVLCEAHSLRGHAQGFTDVRKNPRGLVKSRYGDGKPASAAKGRLPSSARPRERIGCRMWLLIASASGEIGTESSAVALTSKMPTADAAPRTLPATDALTVSANPAM